MMRKAEIKDIKAMQTMINGFAKQDVMLARSLNELYENIRDFWVKEAKGKVVGCAALHISWDDLAEIKSVAVLSSMHGRGIGKELINACLDEARGLGIKKVFMLTYKPKYFKKFGFKEVNHSSLPHKIWAECIHCPKFPDCKETALLKVL